jgi:ribosomal protein S18 acetylase RimI-like enzyme
MAAARTAGVRLAIRKADAADAETISSICADAFQEDIETARGFIVHSLAVPHRRLYLGALPGSGASGPAVCCCALAFEGKDVSINTVAVARAYQGQGYAKEFLSRILAAEVPKGGDITIDVDSTNERAFGLYRSLGFVESRTVDYYLACPFP